MVLDRTEYTNKAQGQLGDGENLQRDQDRPNQSAEEQTY